MKKIIIASKNPVKIRATKIAFEKMFPAEEFEFQGISVPSGVSDQPKNDPETFLGALNRAENVFNERSEADFFVGIEGGIEENNSEMEAFAWIVVKTKKDETSKAKTSTFFLPPRIVELIKQGKELGEADDIVFSKTNSKQENGAVGILTDNIIDREKYYEQAIILALIPFKNRELYNLKK